MRIKNIISGCKVIIILILLLNLDVYEASAQPGFGQKWEKFTNNPLFSTVGESGSWNSSASDNVLSAGHAVQDDVEFKLYIDRFDGQKYSIGLVTSTSLDSGWAFYSGNPILEAGHSGEWDDREVGNAMVINDNGTYKMWYTGKSKSNIFAIGYATSPDGIIWQKDTTNNPVLKAGNAGAWDDEGIFAPYIIKQDEIYKMWYHGFDGAALQIGYATSPDGIAWMKDEQNNPVLDIGESGYWDHSAVALPVVKYENEKYLMWYVGLDDFQSPNSKEETGFASSDDGVHWTKDTDHNPVLPVSITGEWDNRIVAVLDVFNNENSYKMLYGGMDLKTNYGVGLARLDQSVFVEKYRHKKASQFQLFQNYPNPFNPSTTIKYSLPEISKVVLKIFNPLGEEIVTLVDKFQSAGEKSVIWDGRDGSRQVVNSGVYIYSLRIGNAELNRKMIMLK